MHSDRVIPNHYPTNDNSVTETLGGSGSSCYLLFGKHQHLFCRIMKRVWTGWIDVDYQ